MTKDAARKKDIFLRYLIPNTTIKWLQIATLKIIHIESFGTWRIQRKTHGTLIAMLLDAGVSEKPLLRRALSFKVSSYFNGQLSEAIKQFWGLS